uniref:Uncharacterized protein n=1 Tax=Ciona intestinalis TaxID=7719 RepID=H2XYA2_CIOIN
MLTTINCIICMHGCKLLVQCTRFFHWITQMLLLVLVDLVLTDGE